MTARNLCLLHGYLLEGSGSNLWTRSMVQALCQQGITVHLVCQENHPELYDFIAEAVQYFEDGSQKKFYQYETPYPGKCILHKPCLGKTLPVYVRDNYEEFDHVVPMIELDDQAIENYITRNVNVVKSIVTDHQILHIIANHSVLMPTVAQKVQELVAVDYSIVPHGSAIEYAIKKDQRFFNYALEAFKKCKSIFVMGDEIKSRIIDLFSNDSDIMSKFKLLKLGVNCDTFKMVAQEDRRAEINTLIENTQNVLLNEQLKKIKWETDPMLLFVGRIIAAKGVQAIVVALPFILEKYPNAKLLIVGSGPLEEDLGDLLKSLQSGKIAPHLKEISPEIAVFLSLMKERGELLDYFSKCKSYLKDDSVIFTGYMTHDHLKYLMPCCDLAIFPSIVLEAGPLVFLEAMASGCFPLGNYAGGMSYTIDILKEIMNEEENDLMKIGPDESQIVLDIADKSIHSMKIKNKYRSKFREFIVDEHEWKKIASVLMSNL